MREPERERARERQREREGTSRVEVVCLKKKKEKGIQDGNAEGAEGIECNESEVAETSGRLDERGRGNRVGRNGCNFLEHSNWARGFICFSYRLLDKGSLQTITKCGAFFVIFLSDAVNNNKNNINQSGAVLCG